MKEGLNYNKAEQGRAGQGRHMRLASSKQANRQQSDEAGEKEIGPKVHEANGYG